ncbi:MAG TPA: hypothetical protein VGC87_13005 [Pyrinomonadaceae bacterium]|jgi:hypothetical protein
MKTCPACQKTYDDAQNFCLDDGATLVSAPPPGGGYSRTAAPTEMLQGTPTAGYQGTTSPPPPYSPPPPQWAPPAAQKRSPLPWILVGAFVLIAAVVGIILATRGPGTTTAGGTSSTPSSSPGRTTSAAAGQPYDDPGGRFTVTLPSGYPSFKSQKQSQPSVAGPVEFNLLMSEKPDDAFMVGYLDFPQAVFEGNSDKKLLEGGLDGSLKNINATLEKKEDITVQGRNGVAVYGSATNTGKPYYVRFNYILDKPRAYQVGYLAFDRANLDKPEVQAFFDSFKMK